MDRKQRMAVRKNQRVTCLNESARALDAAMHKAGVTSAEKEQFLDWTITSLWDTFKQQRMNQRIIIENEVRQLGLRFPNGTVKKEYSISFDLPLDKISDIELIGAKELGLTLSIGKDGRCDLIGKPKEAGDFTLRLRYSTVEGEPRSELPLPVAFNPDPKELWRNIETDPNIPYYKRDSYSDYINVKAEAGGGKRKNMVAASQRGRSHAQEGKPRDDHFSLFHCDESDWYIMAVADGAGSARYSRWGSKVACETVTEHCRAKLLDNPAFESSIRDYVADRENTDKRTNLTRNVIDIVYNGARKAFEALKKVAEANEDSRLKDFATTLMFAICKRYDFGWFIASFWVGDGAMGLYDAATRSIKLLGTPDEGEFSGQTRFLTMPEIFKDPDVLSKRVRMAVVPDFTALFLMSDGISDPMFETDKNLNDYDKWEEFCNKLKNGFPEDEIGGVDLADDNEDAASQLLGWLDFWSPGNHDDRTIAILY